MSVLSREPTAPVRRLPLAGGRMHSGNAAGSLEPAAQFAFLPAPGADRHEESTEEEA